MMNDNDNTIRSARIELSRLPRYAAKTLIRDENALIHDACQDLAARNASRKAKCQTITVRSVLDVFKSAAPAGALVLSFVSLAR